MTNLTNQFFVLFIQFFVLLRHLNRQSQRVNIKWLTLCKKGFIIVACCFFLPSLSKVSVTLGNNWLTCPISVYFIPSSTNSINIIMSSSSSPSLLSLLYHYYHHCSYFNDFIISVLHNIGKNRIFSARNLSSYLSIYREYIREDINSVFNLVSSYCWPIWLFEILISNKFYRKVL